MLRRIILGMGACLYILKCSDGTYYVGSTRSLDARIRQHSIGLGAEYTRRRLPVELVFSAEFDHIGEAFEMEKRVQKWSRAKREALIRGDFEALHQHARCRNDTASDKRAV
ncbi:GIY-YIG nuclease family protein [Gordonia sp. (in: high G+C Gram-positive bacteria)]|uniref:GIY-YIG nuclease family protein n=1 Tax=Gordonia sp. (in: high G+C Gram-positive bacteria) TaxID=84139 RepID=UPI003459CFC6